MLARHEVRSFRAAEHSRSHNGCSFEKKSFDALSKGKVLRKYLNHIRASPLIEKLIFLAEKIRKRLTVLAQITRFALRGSLTQPLTVPHRHRSGCSIRSFLVFKRSA